MASQTTLALIVTPGFNLAATMAFIDPFRVANYLAGAPLYRWTLATSEGGPVTASNGLSVATEPLSALTHAPDMGVISTSWTPEAFYGPPLDATLRRWARFGTTLVGIDTGAFVLASAGLLEGHRATVHYEHLDAFAETFPGVAASEDLYVIDRLRLSAAGGVAAGDLALTLLRRDRGAALANAAARYLFHPELRPEGTRQLAAAPEPVGALPPEALRTAIQFMEQHLEEVLPIPEIATAAGLSQRHLARLFHLHVGKSLARYYTDIRLDRARGLVTQTEMAIHEIALACGFASAEHFSRVYRQRFGLTARRDRVEGRVPFEFRAWPMHRPYGRQDGQKEQSSGEFR
ncbi:MAG: GlxA family transcriptional regulator [Pseudomonadota bacterium]